MNFFFDFLGLYYKHLSAIDFVILLLGGLSLAFQFKESRFLALDTASLINKGLDDAKNRARRVVRVTTLAIDGFPLLGLLGTVASLLVTFAGIKGNHVTTNVISDFAPGLTSTVSGLLCSLVNLAVFQLLLVPAVEELRRRGESNG